MSKTKIALLTATVLIVYPYVNVLFLKYKSEVALMERYPDLDRQVVIRAHRQMCLGTLKGEHDDVDMDDDATMDALFMSYVNNLK